MKTHVVLPMAGRGERFRQNGYTTIKPLIQRQGQPLFHWAMRSLQKIWPQTHWTIAICDEDQIENEVRQSLQTFDLEWELRVLPKRTKGPAETVLKCLGENNERLVSFDCDLSIEFHDEKEILTQGNQLYWFESEFPEYSYIEEHHNQIIQVHEKKPISKKAIAGCYVFEQSQVFKSTARQLLNQNQTPTKEVYISDVINAILAQGYEFTAKPLKLHRSLGTPRDLELEL